MFMSCAVVPPLAEPPHCPELRLMLALIDDAAMLVRGSRYKRSAKREPPDVAAARRWIALGNVGAITFDDACAWLRWSPEAMRRAIFSKAAMLE